MESLAVAPLLSSGLRVTTVGTGTCVPRLERLGPCVLVRGQGKSVAVDLGLGCLHGLLRLGLTHRDLDAVLLTHLHPDHLADLPSFLFAANYDEVPRQRPVVLAGGAGVLAFVEGLSDLFGSWLRPKGYPLEIREMAPGETLELGSLRCRAGSVRHIPSSLAYRFEVGGRSAVVSGDTGPSPELEELACGANLLLLEASLAKAGSAAGHLSAAQAGELAQRAGAERLVLTHLTPAAETAGPAAAAAAAFDREVLVARDGMTVDA